MNNNLILIYDTEAGEGVGTFYDAYQTNIRTILQHKYILCIAYAWYDPKEALKNPLYVPKIHCVSLIDFPARFKNNPFDDYDVMREISPEFQKAHYRVAYNGKRFDDKVSNTRLVYHGLPAIDTYNCKMIDPLRTMRREFYLERNNLNSVCEYFGIEGKTKVTYLDVNDECSQLKNWWEHKPIQIDKKAWKLMTDYCKQDVRALCQLYTKVRGYDRMHPNMTLTTRKDGCPTCGSPESKIHGYRRLASGKVKQRLECLVCHHTYTERQAELIDDFEPLYT